MTLPVPERIAEVIKTRLETITIANGYTFDIVSVDRPKRFGTDWRPRNMSAVIVQGSDNENEEQTHPGNPPAIGYDTEFSIHAFVIESDYSEETFETQVNEFVTAIKKAVVAGSNYWGQFGGLSLFAEWGRVQPYYSEDGDNQGAVVPLTVTYRVSERDPFEVRA